MNYRPCILHRAPRNRTLNIIPFRPYEVDVGAPVFTWAHESHGPDHRMTHQCRLFVESADLDLHHVVTSDYCANGARAHVLSNMLVCFVALVFVLLAQICNLDDETVTKSATQNCSFIVVRLYFILYFTHRRVHF